MELTLKHLPLLLFTPVLLLITSVALIKGGRPCRSYWLAWAGLAATMVGDFFLAIQGAPLQSDGFLYGIAGFSLAHLCWIAFLSRHARWSPRVAAALTFSLSIFFVARLAPALHAPRLQIAVPLYTLLSVISVAFACGTHRLSPAWRYGLCGLLFSDIMIAFGHILHVAHLKHFVGISYLASLLCIAFAISRCAADPCPHGRLKKLRQAPWFVLLGGPLALAAFIYAMRVCPVIPAYNPCFKMLSYLGRTHINNIDYPLCHYLFTFALAISAFISARFCPAMSCFVRGARQKNVLIWSGALNAAGLLTIAIVPENVNVNLHNVGCFAAVIGGGIMLTLMTSSRNNPRIHRAVRWGLMVWALVLVALFELALLGHRFKILPFSPYVPTCQKLLIMTFVAWLTYYAAVMVKMTRRPFGFSYRSCHRADTADEAVSAPSPCSDGCPVIGQQLILNLMQEQDN